MVITNPTSGGDGPSACTAVAMADPLAGLEPGRAVRARRAARSRLRAWRLETMRLRGWRNAAYRVITDKTLDSILARWPTTSAELRACYGIGRVKQSDWQDEPNPPGVTPLLTVLGPRPRAAIGAAPPPGDWAPWWEVQAAAATAAAAPPTVAAGRPRSPAVARAHDAAAQARRGRETAAASRLRARQVAGPSLAARASPLRLAVDGPDSAPNIAGGSVPRTDANLHPRTDANEAYLNIVVRSLPFAAAPPPAIRHHMGRCPRFPGTDNFRSTHDDEDDTAAALAASADDDGRPGDAPREPPAPGERPPTSWVGLRGGDVPRRTPAASARYLAMIEAGEVFDGGLGGRVRGELDARPEPLPAEPREGHRLHGGLRAGRGR